MKKYAVTMIAALAMASAASADTNVIHIAGSTAFRKATNHAIRNALKTGFKYGYNGTDQQAATSAQYIGQLSDDTWVDVRALTCARTTTLRYLCYRI